MSSSSSPRGRASRSSRSGSDSANQVDGRQTYELGSSFVLALVPLTLVGAWWTFRRPGGGTGVELFKNIQRLWASHRGLSDSPYATRRRARGVLLAIGMLCAVVASARPQWGTIEEKTYDQSREVPLALDLSRSMLADDVSPTRLDRAKLLIKSLLDRLSGERVAWCCLPARRFSRVR